MITIVVAYFLVSGLIGSMIGAQKGRKGTGIVYGLVLGPLGWLVMFFSTPAKPDEKPFSIIGILVILAILGGGVWALMPSAAERQMNETFRPRTAEEAQFEEDKRKADESHRQSVERDAPMKSATAPTPPPRGTPQQSDRARAEVPGTPQ